MLASDKLVEVEVEGVTTIEHWPVKCIRCDRWFIPQRSTAKYCSAACRLAMYLARRYIRCSPRRDEIVGHGWDWLLFIAAKKLPEVDRSQYAGIPAPASKLLDIIRGDFQGYGHTRQDFPQGRSDVLTAAKIMAAEKFVTPDGQLVAGWEPKE
jgi:hypothetical protein